MIWLIYIINVFLWGFASIVLATGLESFAFGAFYFIFGYPLSLIMLKYSDNYAVSYLDTLKYTPFKIWTRKLLWSNSVAMGILWGIILLVALIYKIV
jgi:hypothetical protein